MLSLHRLRVLRVEAADTLSGVTPLPVLFADKNGRLKACP